MLQYKSLKRTLQELNFIEVTDCLQIYKRILIFFYIDDIVLAFPPQESEKAHRIKDNLIKAYEIKIKGELNFFYGVQVIRDRTNRKLQISLDAYIKKIAYKFGITALGRILRLPLLEGFTLGGNYTATT